MSDETDLDTEDDLRPEYDLDTLLKDGIRGKYVERISRSLQPGVSPIQPEEYPRVVDVWEASVRATHHFVREEDIQFFKPLVRGALPNVPALMCVRDTTGQVAGFIGVSGANVDILFIHPGARGQGAGRRLMRYAIDTLGATTVDVNEQNAQAVGFYLHLGFVVAGRSELDGTGKPYPILHLRLRPETSTT